MHFRAILFTSMLWFITQAASAQSHVDPGLPSYKRTASVTGNLKTVGSDTMNSLVTLWSEEFKNQYKGVKAEIDGKGSSNAIPALTTGTASFGPMSRDAKESEKDAFKAKFGFPPTLVPVAIDMLAVYVHRDNPIESLTFEQLDAVFSSTRKLGSKMRVKNWRELGVSGPSAEKSITCYGRNAASGTYGYFKEKVLADGDFGDWVGELAGSSAVVQSVGENPFGIGYSGIGYRTANVKPLALAMKTGGKAVAAEGTNAYDGSYPLARFLYLAVNHDPRRKLDPLRTEFIKYVLSKEGQTQVIKDGYLPVGAAVAREALKQVGIATGF